MVVRRHGTTACVGGGHFVCTLRREVIAAMPQRPSLKAYGGGAEQIWKDRPPDRMGYWRLATARSFTYHLGNVPEPWMYDELERCRVGTGIIARPTSLPRARPTLIGKVPWHIRNGLVSKLRTSRLQSAVVKRALSRGNAVPAGTSA